MNLAPPPSQKPSIAQVFARQGFVIVGRMAPEPMLAKARDHLAARAAAGSVITNDEQVPGAPCVYGGVVLDGLMEELRPAVEHCTGLRLWPTYSYGRLYRKGDALPTRGGKARNYYRVTNGGRAAVIETQKRTEAFALPDWATKLAAGRLIHEQ